MPDEVLLSKKGERLARLTWEYSFKMEDGTYAPIKVGIAIVLEDDHPTTPFTAMLEAFKAVTQHEMYKLTNRAIHVPHEFTQKTSPNLNVGDVPGDEFERKEENNG